MTDIRSLVTAMTMVAATAVPAMAEDPPPRLWTGSAELSYVATSGNTDTSSLGFGGELHYKPGVWAFEARAGYVEAESDGVTNAETLTALLGASRSINARLDYYARLSYLSDEFSGIDSTLSADTGLAYKALTGDRHFLELGGGVGYTSEDRVIGQDRDFATGTAFARYRLAITKTSEFSNQSDFVHDFENSGNWRFLNNASVSAAINSILSLKAYHKVVHLNEPVPGFEETDSTTGVSLVAKF